MTWFMQVCRAGWGRWDAWRKRRDSAFDADPQVVELRRINRESGGGVEDTGLVTPSEGALRAIGPRDIPKQRGRRYEGKHRRVIPDQPVRRDEP